MMRISDWSSDVCSSDLGAWAQSRRATAQIPPSVAQQASVGKQLARDEIYMRENVKLLAVKVGKLQARLIALNEIGGRVAQRSTQSRVANDGVSTSSVRSSPYHYKTNIREKHHRI